MKTKYTSINTQLAVFTGASKRKARLFKRTEEVKETKALLQAHELL